MSTRTTSPSPAVGNGPTVPHVPKYPYSLMQRERKIAKLQEYMEQASFILAGSTFAIALNLNPIAAVAYSTISYLSGKLAYWTADALGRSYFENKSVVQWTSWALGLAVGVSSGAAFLGTLTAAHSLAITTLALPLALAFRWVMQASVDCLV